MPHDAVPRNGRMYGAGMPGWLLALALALAFCAAAFVVAIATGLFVMLVPALGVIALGYGIYLLVAASRHRARFAVDWERIGAGENERAMSRRRWLRRR